MLDSIRYNYFGKSNQKNAKNPNAVRYVKKKTQPRIRNELIKVIQNIAYMILKINSRITGSNLVSFMGTSRPLM